MQNTIREVKQALRNQVGAVLKQIPQEQRVAAYNWGLVAGKTQTVYPWDSWKTTYTNEPPVWFHDIFRADGSAYRPAEVAYIRSVTGKAARQP